MATIKTIYVCPICGLPSTIEKKWKQKGCTFFTRCGPLKFGEYEAGEVKKSLYFTLWHAEICKKCLAPKELCHDRKVAQAVKLIEKENGYNPGGDVLLDVLENVICRKPSFRQFDMAEGCQIQYVVAPWWRPI